MLKPRTHILMENDIKRYSPYLQPLLDEKDSTYKLIPKLGTVWTHLETAMSPEYLPHQKRLERDDPKLNEPNDTLLLVANLAHHPRKIFRGFPSLSMLVTYQLLSAARSHALFHKYGLVRMLLWVPDEEKMQLLPRHVHGIRKTAIEALVTCESIREIASSTEDTSRFLRDQTLALENSVEVVKRMNSQGITTPVHRQGDLEVAARNIVAGGTHEGFSDLQRFKRSYSSQIEDLQRRYDNGELSMRLDPDPEDPSAIPQMNPEWEALIRLSSKVRQQNRETAANDKLIDEYMEINHLDAELNAADPDAEATQNAKKALDDRKKAWVATLEAMKTPAWNHFIVRFDSRRVTTPFEKRDSEPLKVYSKEFYPASNAALLDLQPKALWPCLAKDFPKNYDVFEYIIGNMYASPTQSVKDAFIGLWPGAYEQLRDNCPSLTDGKTGSCFGLEHMTVRSLTMEMLQEIIEAWLKWPFRPTRFDLMKRSGSSVYDPDSEEEFDGGADM
jgi:transcription factor 1